MRLSPLKAPSGQAQTEALPNSCGVVQAAAEEQSAQASFFVDLDMQRLLREELECRCRLWAEGLPPMAVMTHSPYAGVDACAWQVVRNL